MKVLRIFIIIVLLLSLIGCTQETITPANTQEEKTTQGETAAQEDNTSQEGKEAREERGTQEEQYQTRLIFIKKTAEVWNIVDERGNIHQVNVTQVDSSMQPGCTTRGKVTISQTGETSVDIDPGYSMSYVQPVKASYEEAPVTYAALLLDNSLYSGYPDYAISEYDLKDVQVKKAYGLGRIDAVMIFDAKPMEGAYWWGQVESDGWVRNKQINFTIYGAEGTWLSIDTIFQYFSPDYEPIEPPKTKYTPTENQNVIYEDDQWSYFGDKDFLPPRNSDPLYADIKEYMGIIKRVNRESGEVEILYQGDRNYSYGLFCRYNNLLYILSDTWEPFSEGRPGYFGVLDLETKEYKKLIDGAVVRAAIDGKTGYLFANDKLIEIDLQTANLKTIGSLNFFPNYSYDGIQVNRIKDGKMYFGVFSHTVKQYVIDLKSGNITEIFEIE